MLGRCPPDHHSPGSDPGVWILDGRRDPEGLSFTTNDTQGLVSGQGSWLSFGGYFEGKLETGGREAVDYRN